MSDEPNDTSADDEAQRILDECLAQDMADWSQAVAEACRQHPEHAAALQLRFDALKSAGLVETGAPVRRTAPADGSTFGGFELQRVLGQGGMGVVHLARQLSTGRQVALKLIRPDLLGQERARKRFRREIEAVSQLDTPGICTIYEAGEVDGFPYVAMRYVQGFTLAQAPESAFGSEASHAGSQSNSRQRVDNLLALFEKIARALHAAHEAGFVHRDVKPGNIMIDEQGEPVVLDFGLARPEEDTGEGLTASAEQLGTPAYMSPEQVQGRSHRLDRRADVYSLGVTMYECLAGRHPFDAPTREVLYQNILAGQAAPLGQTIPVDVRTVVQTAMSRSPDHRYETAAAFADDLRRARLREPIFAKKPSAVQRCVRWCQRQPMVASLLASLLLIAGASVWLAIDANRSRIAAEQESETRGRVMRFLVNLFEVPNGNTYRGQTITAREVLDQGFREIQNGLTDEPRIRAQLMMTMGEVYHQLGMLERAVGLLEQAQELQQQVGVKPEDAAQLERILGLTAADNQDYAQADEHYERALDILKTAGLERSYAAAEVLDLQSKIRAFDGDFDVAQELMDRSHALHERLGSTFAHKVRYRHNRARLELDRGDAKAAQAQVQQAIELLESGNRTAYSEQRLLATLSESLLAQNKIDEAKAAIDKGMALMREAFGEDHPRFGVSLSNLGQIAARSGAPAEAVTYHTEAHRLAVKYHGPDSAAAATQLCLLGSTHIDLGKFDKAKTYLEDALAKRRKIFDNKGAPLGRCLVFLGELHGIQSQHQPAIKWFREAYEVLSEALGDTHPDTKVAIHYLSVHLKATGSEEAETWRAKLK